MSRGPVFAAYADGALARPCPNCGAAVEAFCTFPDGTPRHIPCCARLREPQGQSEASTDGARPVGVVVEGEPSE